MVCLIGAVVHEGLSPFRVRAPDDRAKQVTRANLLIARAAYRAATQMYPHTRTGIVAWLTLCSRRNSATALASHVLKSACSAARAARDGRGAFVLRGMARVSHPDTTMGKAPVAVAPRPAFWNRCRSNDESGPSHMSNAVTDTEAAILKEHLPYELDMLEGAFVFLHSADSAAQRQNTILKNAMIEAFWTHARNLIEFLTHPKGNDSAGVVSAKDFAKAYFHKLNMDSIDDLVNAQISHLTYERRSASEENSVGTICFA
jgi:hypothetical protein